MNIITKYTGGWSYEFQVILGNPLWQLKPQHNDKKKRKKKKKKKKREYQDLEIHVSSFKHNKKFYT